jgi:hypothetical protein
VKETDVKSFLPYFILTCIAVVFTICILITGENYFFRFFGPVHPLLIVFTTSLLGALCLYFLKKRAGIRVTNSPSLRNGITAATSGAIIFTLPVISADLLFRFHQNINIPPPAAFFFYPAIGFIAETIFHLLPLTIGVFFIKPYRGNTKQIGIPISVLLPAIAAEPLFQVFFSGALLAATGIFTFFHVLLISIFQISLLKRYDYVTMVIFRMVYYLLWHILWGVLRLKLLF